MRVSSLSDSRVIRLVTKYFVPVWFSRDNYQMGEMSKEEQAEILRIDRDKKKHNLEGGNVCVYLLRPDGAVVASLPVQRASNSNHLVPFLEKFIADEKLTPRPADTAKATAAAPRMLAPAKPSKGGLLLHTWVRAEDKGPNRGTSQDWVEWTAADCRSLTPAMDYRVGASWEIPREVVYKLFEHCYPPGPHWKALESKVASGELKATVVAIAKDEVRVKLEGKLDVIYPYEGKETDAHTKARVLGYLRYDPVKQAITTFILTSEAGESVWYWQGKPQPNNVAIAVKMES
jgi:hypothetical protein